MKNKLFNTIFFLTILFGTLLLSESSSYADTCHVDADGKVLVENHTDGSATRPLGTDGKVLSTDGGATYAADGCTMEPLEYKVKMYKILLCTDDPYVAGGNAPLLDSCIGEVMTNTAGKDVTIIPGEDTEVIEGELELALGRFSYIYSEVDNKLGIKHIVDFVRDEGGAFTLSGYKDHAANYNSGSKCWTVKDKATTYNNVDTDSADGLDGGKTPHNGQQFTQPTPTEPQSLSLTCGAAINTTAGNEQEYGFAYEIIDSIDATCDASNDCHTTFNPFVNYETIEETGDEAAIVLLQEDATVATDRRNATRIGYIVRFEDPLRIRETTIGFKMLFNTKSSVSVDVQLNDKGNGAGADDILEAKKVGANPFSVKIQTKKISSAGTWDEM